MTSIEGPGPVCERIEASDDAGPIRHRAPSQRGSPQGIVAYGMGQMDTDIVLQW